MNTLKIIGPRRALGRIARSFRTGNNFTEDRLTPLSDNACQLWTNELHVPFVNQGIIQSALEVIGKGRATVEVTLRDGQGTTYHCTWE